MKQTSKRLQALVLVLAMCVSFLQIPSFAVVCKNPGDLKVADVTIAQDGKVTITKRCEAHLNEKGAVCEAIAEGQIGVKVLKDGNYEADPSKNDVTKLGTVTVSADCKSSTCVTAGSVLYKVTIGKDTYQEKYTTVAATGKHTPITEQEAKMDFYALEKDKNFELISNTATCKAKGQATFAKYCAGCDKYVETVPVESPMLEKHAYIQEQKEVNGKLTSVPKEFTEEITAATCKVPGKEYRYVQCEGCGTAFYYTDKDKSAVSEIKGRAYEFEVTVPHTYEYTVKQKDYAHAYVGKTLDKDAFEVIGKCSCDATAAATSLFVKDAKLVAEKTVAPKFACVPGSQTYAVTYTKDFGTKDAKDVTVEVTVPYYLDKNSIAKEHVWSENTTTDMDTYKAPTCTEAGHLDQVWTCTVCGEKKVAHTVTTPATGKHTAAAAKKENVVAATTKKGGSYDLVVRCADCGKVLSKKHKTTAKIVVKASKINSVKNYKGKKAKVSLKKASSISGYQIQYGTKKNFKGAKAVKTKATTKYLTKLAKNKKYYVRVRTYKVVSGKTYYSSWSGAKTVTIKK